LRLVNNEHAWNVHSLNRIDKAPRYVGKHTICTAKGQRKLAFVPLSAAVFKGIVQLEACETLLLKF
jgi:hypothetical protein